MSEEEKKAIELLKGLCSDDCINKDITETITNLIEKQQKEIEELKNSELDYTTIYINGKFDGEKKYKDKIREKIEEFEHHDFIAMQVRMEHDKKALKIVEVLKELLEEN